MIVASLTIGFGLEQQQRKVGFRSSIKQENDNPLIYIISLIVAIANSL